MIRNLHKVLTIPFVKPKHRNKKPRRIKTRVQLGVALQFLEETKTRILPNNLRKSILRFRAAKTNPTQPKFTLNRKTTPERETQKSKVKPLTKAQADYKTPS